MLEGLAREVDLLAQCDESLMCDSELRETFDALRRLIDRQEGVAASMLAAVHGRGIPAGDGASSTPAWVQWQTGQRVGDAKMSLLAGQACAGLPLTAKTWKQGEISASAARSICRGVKAGHEDVYREIEEMLIERASVRDFRGLDGLIAHYQTRADALDDVNPSDLNGFHHSRVGNRWSTTADYDGLAGETVNTAVNAALDPPSKDDTRSPAKRRADASVRIHRFFLDHADLPLEGGERPHLAFVVSEDPGTGGWRSLDGAITPGDVERLACDARLSVLTLGGDGLPLSIGEARYRPSARLRRAVMARDQGCRFPGCDRPARWTEVHHTPPWPVGPTQLGSLVAICDCHHDILHKPGWKATFDGVLFTVVNPEGRPIGSTRAPPA